MTWMLACAALALGAWLAMRGAMPAGSTRMLLASLAATIPAAFAAACAIGVGLRSEVEPRHRSGWILIGLGCAASAAGSALTLFPLVADASYRAPELLVSASHYVLLVCMLSGLLCWVQRHSLSATLGTLLDITAVALLGYLVVWSGTLRATIAGGGVGAESWGLDRANMLIYPIGDLFLLMAAVTVLSQIGRRDIRVPALLATVGVVGLLVADLHLSLLGSVAGDLHFAYLTTVHAFPSQGFSDLGWHVGFLAIAAGAIRARSPYAAIASGRGLPLLERSITWETVWAMVPFGMLATSILIWEGADVSSENERIAFFALITVLMLRCVALTLHHVRMSGHANVDPLTGAWNHRSFQEKIVLLSSAAIASRRPLSLVMVDIDDFGLLNGAYGHAEGDRLLRETAWVIRECLVPGQLLFRSGGDEFAIALPNTSAEEAEALARRIALECGRLQSPAPIATSLTMGVATLPTHTFDGHELVHLAEGTLYWGKLNGKHSVTVYDPKVVKVLSDEERVKVIQHNAQLRAVLALARALDARDAYTAQHSQNVARYAVAIAFELGWQPEQTELLRMAGLLHDVGKIGVRDATLRKADRLSDEEWDEMRRHPVLSARVISGVAPETIIAWVLGHHERMDGRGYPHRLKGEEIPLGARILAVADSFDAMTSSRSYRPGMPVSAAIREIAQCAGVQFDPVVVRAFLAALRNGTMELDAHEQRQEDVDAGGVSLKVDPEFAPVDHDERDERPAAALATDGAAVLPTTNDDVATGAPVPLRPAAAGNDAAGGTRSAATNPDAAAGTDADDGSWEDRQAA